MVRVVPLGSGSRGNATLLDFDGFRLLADAGLSARELAVRLERVGVAPESVGAIVLSHEHHDHARGAERFSVRHGVRVCASRATLAAMNLSPIHLAAWTEITPGETTDLDGVRIDPFSVPHDAAEPVGFVFEGGGRRVGLATDLGHATTLVVEKLRGCQVLMIESNHDDRMLQEGPYPWHLKQRVGGRLGHLSNDEAAALLVRAADAECRAVILAHLSEKNNTTALARSTVSTALALAGRSRVEMRVAAARRPIADVAL